MYNSHGLWKGPLLIVQFQIIGTTNLKIIIHKTKIHCVMWQQEKRKLKMKQYTELSIVHAFTGTNTAHMHLYPLFQRSWLNQNWIISISNSPLLKQKFWSWISMQLTWSKYCKASSHRLFSCKCLITFSPAALVDIKYEGWFSTSALSTSFES